MPGSTPSGKKPRKSQTLKQATKHPLIPADAVLRTPPRLKVEKKHIKHPANPANPAKRVIPIALVVSGNQTMHPMSDNMTVKRTANWTWQ
jgi:hypothetical protein